MTDSCEMTVYSFNEYVSVEFWSIFQWKNHGEFFLRSNKEQMKDITLKIAILSGDFAMWHAKFALLYKPLPIGWWEIAQKSTVFRIRKFETNRTHNLMWKI